MDSQDRDLVARYFRAKNPNKERVGCPDLSVLEQIASGSLEPGSPWYDHLTNCAACFLQTEELKRSSDSARRRHVRWAVGVAIAASVLLAVLVWWRSAAGKELEAGPVRGPEVQQPKSTAPVPAPPPERAEVRPKETAKVVALAIVDLSAFAVARGAETSGVAIPRIRPIEQRMNLLLPVASEVGKYNIRLLDRDLKRARETTGVAVLKDGRTVLPIILDASVNPGLYQLALQHEGEDWRLYPLDVKD